MDPGRIVLTLSRTLDSTHRSVTLYFLASLKTPFSESQEVQGSLRQSVEVYSECFYELVKVYLAMSPLATSDFRARKVGVDNQVGLPLAPP